LSEGGAGEEECTDESIHRGRDGGKGVGGL
jgi:hypothetical protein